MPSGRGRKTGPLSLRERVRVRETSGAVGKVRRSYDFRNVVAITLDHSLGIIVFAVL
jgi:hypothetical protein